MVRNKMDTWPETRWTHGQKQDGHMARNKMDTWPETRWTHGQKQDRQEQNNINQFY